MRAWRNVLASEKEKVVAVHIMPQLPPHFGYSGFKPAFCQPKCERTSLALSRVCMPPRAAAPLPRATVGIPRNLQVPAAKLKILPTEKNDG